MKPAGLREVERAKADGRWDAAYDSPANATVPPDFEKALKKNKKAKTFFEGLNSRESLRVPVSHPGSQEAGDPRATHRQVRRDARRRREALLS